MLDIPHDGSLNDQIFKFFCRHLVSLNGRWQPLKADGTRSGILQPFSYSAFIISVRGNWVLATAGHILRDIAEYLKFADAELADVHIVDTFGPSPVSPVAIPLDLDTAPFSWIAPDTDALDGHHGLDIGIVLLTANQQELLSANGVVPITEPKWKHADQDQCDFHVIVGLPDEQVREAHVGIVIVGVDRVDELPEGVRPTEYEQFVGRIDKKATFDLKGLSGGLIIGMNRKKRESYWIIAVQSSWLPDKRLTFGVPIQTFGRFVEDEILRHVRPAVFVESRRKKLATIQKAYPNATIIDVTSKGEDPWVKFSPFYPHGDIPIPGTDQTGQSVEGIWQGLKVFEKEGIDTSKWAITNMKGIKRSGTSRGKVLGHQLGNQMLGYLDARKEIYLPVYRWVLENKLQTEVEELGRIAVDGLVLLDYEINGNVNDLSKPLSHASLIAKCIENKL